jgi:hypothetical protein
VTDLDKIFKVFLSSTYEDLRAERAEVEKALLKLDCLPVGMELFPAADDETWEFIKSQIADSDYYIVLVAGRYGSIAGDGRSFTEIEFDCAIEMGKPVIGFVHGNRGSIPLDKSEIDPERAAKLDLFLTKVRLRPVRPFLTPHQLALEVTASVVSLKARRPAVGFVRADQTVDFKKYSELLEENRDLKEQLQQLSLASSQRLMDWLAENTTVEVAASDRHYPIVFEKVAVAWRDIALLTMPQVMADNDENTIFEALAFGLLSRNTDEKDLLHRRDCKIADESRERIRVKFVMEGFVTVSTEQRAYIDFTSPQTRPYNARVWKFTELGRLQLSLLAGKATEVL